MRRSDRLLAFAVLASIPVATNALGATFNVVPGFDIQSAVNAALVNSDLDDTINVATGTYNELVTIDYDTHTQRSLTLIGSGGGRPTIKLGVLIDRSQSVTLKNFRVESPLSDGIAAIAIDRSRRVLVQQCVGKLGDDFGVAATRTFEVVVEACSFSGMVEDGGTNLGGYGISIIGRCGHAVRRCATNDNEHDGILVVADRTKIADNESFRNGDNGIEVEGHVNQVKNNDCEDNDNNGILSLGANELRSNTCSNNQKIGIKWGTNGGAGFSGGEIRSNRCEDNEGGGIALLTDQDGCDVHDNELDGNTEFGIRVTSDHHRIHGNSIDGTRAGSNGGHGILIESSADDCCIDANTFKSNAGQAIQIAGDRNYLVKNAAKGNDGFVTIGSADDNDGRNNTTDTGANEFP